MKEMDSRHLEQAARGGRVVSTGFLNPEDVAKLAAELREHGVSVNLEGGYNGARRRALTAFPEHIPEASVALSAIYIAGVDDEADLRVALERVSSADAIGDVVAHQDGLSAVVLKSVTAEVLTLTRVGRQDVKPQLIDIEHLAKGSNKQQMIIVPSLRVDTLGAKAFNVSRSYFSKGIAGGKVSINGKPAGKSSSAEVGDEIYAEGIGRLSVLEVLGQTKKGNVKVMVDIEKA